MDLALFDNLLLKKNWHLAKWDGIHVYRASALSVMPGVIHGFTTRTGGVSTGNYSSLNVGSHVGDSPDHVDENRKRMIGAFGSTLSDIATAEQVHGASVAHVKSPGGPIPGVDALITDTPGIMLTLMFADCVPIFLFDPVNRAVGVVHSGWKGTDKNVVQTTVDAMVQHFGTVPRLCIAAIGPCISFKRYEVSLDVASRFRNAPGGNNSGAAQVVLPYNEFKGTYLLNLRHIVFQQLTASGLRMESIAVSDQCTFTNKREFFSHRRDGVAGSNTGRMAAIIGLRSSARSRGNR